jgi:transposase
MTDNQSIMASFKDHKVTAADLLRVIPEALMSHLSEHTGVDHYTKVLHGKKMFYLLMYGILENDRLSQRTLEDTFNDTIFKILFGLDEDERICRSSLSERLGKIAPDYFRQIYDCVYEQFSACYSTVEREKYNLIRVDSTIVYDLSSRMVDGFRHNQHHNKCVKISVAFDGMLPCDAGLFTTSEYSSEEKALPDVIRSYVKKDTDYPNLYIIDRGLQSSRTMRDFSNDQIAFIVRARENRKYVELESLLMDDANRDLGSLTLVRDSKVYLYASIHIHSKRGKNFYREELVEHPFRLIVATDKDDPARKFWFITNDFDMTPKEITDNYRRRWDIEVFFRFLKQELNTRHLISLNSNGIRVMLYMTLITAMLVLIYKRANNIGYKTAKRRFAMEIRDMAIQMIVVQCGGDPKLLFKT